jgi:excisionase family DNA binding protein
LSEARLVTVREVVRRTALGRSTVFALLASGALPSVTIGRSRRIRESDLDAWIGQLGFSPTEVTAADVEPAAVEEGRRAPADPRT